MISVEKATNEVRSRDSKRDRVVLSVGNNKFHVSTSEAFDLFTDLGKLFLVGKVVKPCPFCGGDPEITLWHGGSRTKRVVSCENESCTVNPLTTGNTKKKAIEAWNKRS